MDRVEYARIKNQVAKERKAFARHIKMQQKREAAELRALAAKARKENPLPTKRKR